MAEYLSEHFTLEELVYSATAKARGIDNTPAPIFKSILKHTCVYFLEPLRKLLNEKYKEYKGKAVKEVRINITSGYRCSLLNIAVGGSSSSKHIKGEAIDLEAVIVFTNGKKVVLPYTELYEDIKGFVEAKKLSVDQCIQERSGSSKWVHCSHSSWGATRDRKEFLKYNNGKYTLDCVLK